MAKKLEIGNASQILKRFIRFWFFPSYLITTVIKQYLYFSHVSSHVFTNSESTNFFHKILHTYLHICATKSVDKQLYLDLVILAFLIYFDINQKIILRRKTKK